MTQLMKLFDITASAVRSALTADGRPPLDASGLKLHERLSRTSAKPRTGG